MGQGYWVIPYNNIKHMKEKHKYNWKDDTLWQTVRDCTILDCLFLSLLCHMAYCNLSQTLNSRSSNSEGTHIFVCFRAPCKPFWSKLREEEKEKGFNIGYYVLCAYSCKRWSTNFLSVQKIYEIYWTFSLLSLTEVFNHWAFLLQMITF